MLVVNGSIRMRCSPSVTAGCVAALALGWAPAAVGHVSVKGPAFAGTSQVLTVNVGHGCEGADTVRLAVRIPEQVTALRALPGPWGEAEITTNDAGLVSEVAWSKPTARAGDDHYYQFAFRISVPDLPFTKLTFASTQTCRNADGEETTVEWAALPGDTEGEPAAEVTILPARSPGWNRYTVPAAITDLSVFDDAQIVWSGDAAYSKNPVTQELIADERDVTPLTSIAAGAVIWVKY